MRQFSVLIIMLSLSMAVTANDAGVEFVSIKKKGNEFHFSVTLKHADAGWQHYADAWRVVDEKGAVLGTRTLHHPHVDEQPFTRSLGGVKIPENIKLIYVEAHDKVHGWNKIKVKINLDVKKSKHYSIR